MRILKTTLNHETREGNKYISWVLLVPARRGMRYKKHPSGEKLEHTAATQTPGLDYIRSPGTRNDKAVKSKAFQTPELQLIMEPGS